MLFCLGTATDLLDVPNATDMYEHLPLSYWSRDFTTPTHVSFLCARERSRSSLRFFSSVSHAVSQLNRLLVVSSAAQRVNYRAESLAMRTESRERGPALLTCTDEEGGTSCRRKNWGDDLFRREKPLDVRARSRPFFARARAPGLLHAGKIPCKHRSAKQHRCHRSLAKKHNFLALESHVRAGSRPRLPARAQTGLQLLVQFPVTTVHTCRLRRNVQQVFMINVCMYIIRTRC